MRGVDRDSALLSRRIGWLDDATRYYYDGTELPAPYCMYIVCTTGSRPHFEIGGMASRRRRPVPSSSMGLHCSRRSRHSHRLPVLTAASVNPSDLTINCWSNGNKGWSQGPPANDVVLRGTFVGSFELRF